MWKGKVRGRILSNRKAIKWRFAYRCSHGETSKPSGLKSSRTKTWKRDVISKPKMKNSLEFSF